MNLYVLQVHIHIQNGYSIRGYIYQEKFVIQFRLLIIWNSLIGQFVHTVEGQDGWIILARYEFHCIRVHENLMQHPSNYKSIIYIYRQTENFLCFIRLGLCKFQHTLSLFELLLRSEATPLLEQYMSICTLFRQRNFKDKLFQIICGQFFVVHLIHFLMIKQMCNIKSQDRENTLTQNRHC